MTNRNTLIASIKSIQKESLSNGSAIGALVKTIDELLSGVENSRRGLSANETNCIVAAIHALDKKHFNLARANILNALEEARNHHLPNRFPLLNVADLRQRLKTSLQTLSHRH